ncbi:50S ribosomal protein 5, chloroplastic [Glycine soja]
MALSFNSLTLSPLFSSSSTFALPTTAASRVHVILPPKPLNGVRFSAPKRRTDAVVVSAAAEDSISPPVPPAESEKENVSVEKLPLESKLKEREEQKLRMKLAKKIRLRRKRLLRKRRLRKKGRWPPSKMKKLKNDALLGLCCCSQFGEFFYR